MTDTANTTGTTEPARTHRPSYAPGMDDDLQVDDLDRHLAPDQQLRLFVTIFRLPTQVPLPHGDSYAFELPGDLGDRWDIVAAISPLGGVTPLPTSLRLPFVSIRLWQVAGSSDPSRFESIQGVAASIFPNYERFELPDLNRLGEIEPYETVIEAVTQFAFRAEDPADQSLTSTCFDRCLTAVNLLADAVGVVRKDPALHPLVPEQLDLVNLVASRPIDGGFDVDPALLLTHMGFPRHARMTSDPERDAVVSAVSVAFKGHPFLSYMRLKRAAERGLAAGDYAQTAIFASVSIEVVLNVLLRALLIERDESAAEVQARFVDERGGITARLRREYAPLIGGAWRLDDRNSPVGNWVSKAHGLRNRVVHGGYQPSRREVVDAIEAAAGLETFVMDRVGARRYEFPRTALSLLGQPSLARRGLWTGKMARIAHGVVSDLPDFWRRIEATA